MTIQEGDTLVNIKNNDVNRLVGWAIFKVTNKENSKKPFFFMIKLLFKS